MQPKEPRPFASETGKDHERWDHLVGRDRWKVKNGEETVGGVFASTFYEAQRLAEDLFGNQVVVFGRNDWPDRPF